MKMLFLVWIYIVKIFKIFFVELLINWFRIVFVLFCVSGIFGFVVFFGNVFKNNSNIVIVFGFVLNFLIMLGMIFFYLGIWRVRLEMVRYSWRRIVLELVGVEEEERGRRMLSRELWRGGRDLCGSWERLYVIL